MAQQPREQRPGQGVLFINIAKQGAQPDYKGTLTLDQDYRAGEQIQISGWKKDTKLNHLISLSVNNYKKEQYPKPVVKDDNEVPF
jgi:hypothetical protein